MFAAQGVALALLRARADRRAASRSTSRCSMRRWHCSPIRPATTSRAATCRRGSATATRRSCRTKRSPPSDGEFVLAVGNDEQWRRFCAVAESGATTSASPPTVSASRATTRCGRSSPSGCRSEPRQHWIEALTAAGVPCGSVRNFEELFADPQLAAREMIAIGRARDDRAAESARRAGQAVGHAGRGAHGAADARPAHRRGAAARSGIERRRDRRLAPAAGHLNPWKFPSSANGCTETIERARKQAAERRGRGERGDPRLRGLPAEDRRAAVPAGRQRTEGRRLCVHRVHARPAASA